MGTIFKQIRLLSALIIFFGSVLLLSFPSYAFQLPDFTEIVKDNSPAVVRIEIEQKPRGMRGLPREQYYQELPEYLRRFFEGRGMPPQQRRQSLGSGFIISEDGYIVTNNHVVSGADGIIVRMSDRREFVAELVGTDERSDLALLKVDGDDLPTLSLAKNDELEVGEWVLAMGSPFGLDYSVSAGIVSAKGRSLPTQKNENYVPFVQTDVAINPGNSGGPLFNLKGEVVGVNSQIYTRSGGSIGLSFAIPVNVVRNVVDQLRGSGSVIRGWLGVNIQDVDKSLADSFGLDSPRGSLIAELEENGPAQRGGLKAGDIIVRFNGEEILESAGLPHVVGLTAPGSEVQVEVIRNRKIKKLTITIGSLGDDQSPTRVTSSSIETQGGKLGLVVHKLDEQMRERSRISHGVVVSKVIPGGAGAEAGIQRGDVITLIDASPIDSLEAYEQVVSELEDKASFPMRIIRHGRPVFIGIRISN